MAYILEVKSRDDPSPTTDYIEVVLAPGEVVEDYDIAVYLRNGTLDSRIPLENGTVVVAADGTQFVTLSVQTVESGNPRDPAGVALVSDPDTVEQFIATGVRDITPSEGPASGLTATAIGNSSTGDSHYWSSDGTYLGTAASTPGTICFAKGTSIDTRQGARPVEDLVVGDSILTRDNGYKRLKWIGKSHKTTHDTARHPSLRPIVIRKDAFGLGCPSRDLVVSQQHRILSSRVQNSLLFGVPETLVAAKHMRNDTSVISGGICAVTYFHLMFDDHEILRSNNTWTESFLPHDYALSTLSPAALADLHLQFPALNVTSGGAGYTAARYVLKKSEAKVLLM